MGWVVPNIGCQCWAGWGFYFRKVQMSMMFPKMSCRCATTHRGPNQTCRFGWPKYVWKATKFEIFISYDFHFINLHYPARADCTGATGIFTDYQVKLKHAWDTLLLDSTVFENASVRPNKKKHASRKGSQGVPNTHLYAFITSQICEHLLCLEGVAETSPAKKKQLVSGITSIAIGYKRSCF